MPNKINVKLYDYDQCLAQENQGPEVQDWIIKKNQDFFNEQILNIQAEDYYKVIIASGSNRQSYNTDCANVNKYKNGSSAPLLPLLQSYIDKEINKKVGQEKINVVLDKFLMADIYGHDLKSGDSYIRILKQLYCNQDLIHAIYRFDSSKITLLYAYAHRVATLHPQDQIVIDFYDDSDWIIATNFSFFSQCPNLLPKNVILRITQYKGEPLTDSSKKSDINGTGKIDDKYYWTVRFLFVKNCHAWGIEYTTLHSIESADELFTLYKNNYNNHNKMIILPENAKKIDTYLKDYESELAKLPTSDLLTQDSYTTASQLLEENLIPEKFFLKPELGIVPESMPLPAHEPKSEPIEFSPTITLAQLISDNDFDNISKPKLKSPEEIAEQLITFLNNNEFSWISCIAKDSDKPYRMVFTREEIKEKKMDVIDRLKKEALYFNIELYKTTFNGCESILIIYYDKKGIFEAHYVVRGQDVLIEPDSLLSKEQLSEKQKAIQLIFALHQPVTAAQPPNEISIQTLASQQVEIIEEPIEDKNYDTECVLLSPEALSEKVSDLTLTSTLHENSDIKQTTPPITNAEYGLRLFDNRNKVNPETISNIFLKENASLF